jgi:hypothetical protein
MAGGYDVSSYPSKDPEKLDWHASSRRDAEVDKEMNAARLKGAPWKVYFVGQSFLERQGTPSDTTYPIIMDRDGRWTEQPPNVGYDEFDVITVRSLNSRWGQAQNRINAERFLQEEINRGADPLYIQELEQNFARY